MSKIYFLNSDVSFNDHLIYTNDMRMETTLCPLNAGLPSQHAMRQHWVRPIKVVGPVQRMTDFEWSVYNDIFVENDIVNKLQSTGFSGIEFRSAELYTTTETPIGRQLFELKVTGWGGMAHPSSGIRVQEKCPLCGRSVYRGHTSAAHLFDIDKWDGSDFFLIWPMPKYVFVTSEVAKFILKERYSGVNVCELGSFPKSIAGGYSPGHIQDWYDKEEAAKIITEL
jgi:hypothetical protein